jgi:hypothetical protein
MKTFNAPANNQTEPLTYTDLAPRTFTAACAAKLEAIKNNLVAKLTAEFSDLQASLVRQAVDEADALAALTGFPHLLFPDLALEKVQSARDWSRHQQAVRQGHGWAFAA